LGLAAQLRGIPAHIVVPENAPAIKIANMRESGAVLHFCAATEAARVATAQTVAQATGALLVHSSSDPLVIAGQGTATLELLATVPELDGVIAPVGGGGLIAGTAIAAHAISPKLQIYAAEPSGAADAWRAMQAGEREQHPLADTICDGLRTGIGAINFAIMQRERVAVLTASDAEIVAAMRLLWDRLKLVVEPSAAVPLAVLLKTPERFARQRIGVIISGGNVDLAKPLWSD
jgi:threonine dehydratase